MKFFPQQPNYGNYFAEIYFVEKRVIKTLNTQLLKLCCFYVTITVWQKGSY